MHGIAGEIILQLCGAASSPGKARLVAEGAQVEEADALSSLHGALTSLLRR